MSSSLIHPMRRSDAALASLKVKAGKKDDEEARHGGLIENQADETILFFVAN